MKSIAPQITAPSPRDSARPMNTFISFAGGTPHEISLDGATFEVRNRLDNSRSRWVLDQSQSKTILKWIDGKEPCSSHVLAVLDGFFVFRPSTSSILIAATRQSLEELAHSGVVVPQTDHGLATRDTLWQQAQLWTPFRHDPIAQQYVLTAGKRHPRRPPKPKGVLYQRFIPWLEKTFSFRSVELERDLPMFSRWMNDPDVAKIWEEEGDLEKHRNYLTSIDSDPHMYSMIASLDGKPFGYFEVYWAKESRISPFYDVDDYDRGWHVLVGEPSYRGKAFATSWLTSISHYIFLCDPRTQRAVGEPRIDHFQQIRNLDKSGYAKVKEFDLPHKRALLVMMLRERYFSDALWLPRGE